jgi:hypothetical protein
VTEAELRSAIWAALNSPNTSAEEMVSALRGFLRMTADAEQMPVFDPPIRCVSCGFGMTRNTGDDA